MIYLFEIADIAIMYPMHASRRRKETDERYKLCGK